MTPLSLNDTLIGLIPISDVKTAHGPVICYRASVSEKELFLQGDDAVLGTSIAELLTNLEQRAPAAAPFLQYAHFTNMYGNPFRNLPATHDEFSTTPRINLSDSFRNAHAVILPIPIITTPDAPAVLSLLRRHGPSIPVASHQLANEVSDPFIRKLSSSIFGLPVLTCTPPRRLTLIGNRTRQAHASLLKGLPFADDLRALTRLLATYPDIFHHNTTPYYGGHYLLKRNPTTDEIGNQLAIAANSFRYIRQHLHFHLLYKRRPEVRASIITMFQQIKQGLYWPTIKRSPSLCEELGFLLHKVRPTKEEIHVGNLPHAP